MDDTGKKDDASTGGNPAARDDSGQLPKLSEEQLRAKIRGQVKLVVEGLGGRDSVGWSGSGKGDDLADVEYLYRRGHILVQDSSLERVTEVLDRAQRAANPVEQADNPARPADNLIDGVTLLTLPGGLDVPQALRIIDDELGAGAASPDHVLYVTRIAGCCPAQEPELPGGPAPVPGMSANPSDGRGVLVSVVDTGWHSPAAGHPDTPWLKGVTGDEETINPASIHPYAGHGTFIAGVVRCVAPATEVHVEGFLPHGGAVFESAIVKQLYEALALAPDIISLSAGTHTRNNHPLLSFQAFWRTSLRHLKGTVLVAAAGNDGDRQPFWPAAFPWAVSVGALTPDERHRADFSNFGSWVDVYANGVRLVNAYPKGTFTCQEEPNVGDVRNFEGTAAWSGTSFSTPTVAGIIAARMSHTGESARAAADALIEIARGNAVPAVGAVLTPGAHNLP